MNSSKYYLMYMSKAVHVFGTLDPRTCLITTAIRIRIGVECAPSLVPNYWTLGLSLLQFTWALKPK